MSSHTFPLKGRLIVLHENLPCSRYDNCGLQREFESLSQFKSVLRKTSTTALYYMKTRNMLPCPPYPLNVIAGKGNIYEFLTKLPLANDLSSAIWLLFLESVTDLEQLFSNINIPFNCEFLVAQRADSQVIRLTEVFHISDTLLLQTYLFGNWTPRHGLTGPSVSFYQRRNNLRGTVFKTGTINDNPVKITKESNGKPVDVGGYFGEVWHVMESELNFSSDYYKPRDNAYGSIQQNGSWNGIVAMMERNEVQISNVDLNMNNLRMDVVDYIYPIIYYRLIMFIKMGTDGLVWNNFLKPFSLKLWSSIAVSTVALSTCMSLMKKLTRQERGKYELSYYFMPSFLYVFGAFCYQGEKENISFKAGRVLFLSIHFTALVMVTSYSAFLIAFLTMREQTLPFKDFKDFLDDGTYELGVLANSAEVDYFKKSNNPLLLEVFKKHIAPYESSLANNTLEGLTRVCVRHNYAWITSPVNAVELFKRLTCGIRMVPYAYITGCSSMATLKKSPYRELMKHILHKMLRSGLLQILYQKNLNDKMDIESDSEFSSVSLNEIMPILVILIIGTVISIFLLMTERLLIRKEVVRV